ncbi:MAG TPA: TetR/AcrR family transcriptional regulator, partial [Labilithrix sp.]|nr:TetR/AcrR family transcriptional regulator [Labilithrix sp.]
LPTMTRDGRKVAPRKDPVQGRSREMVDAILDGAVRAFMSASGSVYDADETKGSPSVNRIAEIAGVSIGSLYQYFPGKTAIIAALVRRRMRQIHERLLVVIDESSGLSLEDAARRLVDCIFEMKVSNTGVDDVIMREALRHTLTAEAFTLDAELVGRFADALERWKPKVRPDLPAEIAAHLLFQGLRAVMVVGAVGRPDLTGDQRMREEMQRLIVTYLRPGP